MEEQLYGIIVAAGMGKRAQLGYNKNYAPLGHVPILVRNLHALSGIAFLTHVIIAVAPKELTEARALLQKYEAAFFPTLSWSLVPGGRERQDSVACALQTLPKTASWVAVHDGARPFADAALFERVFLAAKRSGAAVAALPVKDTIKVSTNGKETLQTLKRNELYRVQTPQIFDVALLRRAFSYVTAHNLVVTDDASMVEALGHPVSLVEGLEENFKITTPEDFIRAEGVLKKEQIAMDFHVGSGYDVHRLVPHRPLILCGVTIPYELGLEGHSDADVALHALMDAILGAAGMGDIGRLFPDSDDAYLGADSRKLLREVIGRVEEKGWHIHNADVTIICQRPKLIFYERAMLENLQEDLGLSGDALNVKATTTEKLGFTGRGEGIAAEAVVLLKK